MKKSKKNKSHEIKKGYGEQIRKAGILSLEHNKESVESAIATFNDILSIKTLSSEDRENAILGLAVSYQHIGDHRKAISTLAALSSFPDNKIHSLHLLAISYGALGYLAYSCELFQGIINGWELQEAKNSNERKFRGLCLLEAGKSFSLNENDEKAIFCWEKSLEYLKEFSESEVEHLGRVRANIAFAKIKSSDASVQLEGIKELEESSFIKLKIGDLQGLANNFCNLGSYFRSKKRYGRAIAYYRKDLYLSRIVGNKRDLASTLGNFATLYGELKQFKSARSMLREAKAIAEEIQDNALIMISDGQLEYIDNEAKAAGLGCVGVGDKAECGCGSEKLYSDCCGLADFEPMSLPELYGGISEDVEKIHRDILSKGKNISPLDFILREIPKPQLRKAWAKFHGHDGWVSMTELPDMASIHLVSAREMANGAVHENSLSFSLSAIILSICALESFINQLSYFLYENKGHSELNELCIPQELLDEGAYGYQRKMSLETKWLQISDCLNGDGWLSSLDEWRQIKDLIHIRNELVHFKTNGYEQIVPPPKKTEGIYSKLPKVAKLRDEPHSWPFKILTSSLALWAVDISENLMNILKRQYTHSRRS